jgi:hypothetical protein
MIDALSPVDYRRNVRSAIFQHPIISSCIQSNNEKITNGETRLERVGYLIRMTF